MGRNPCTDRSRGGAVMLGRLRDRLIELLLINNPDTSAFLFAIFTFGWGLWVGTSFGTTTVPPVGIPVEWFGLLLVALSIFQMLGLFGDALRAGEWTHRLHRGSPILALLGWMYATAGA